MSALPPGDRPPARAAAGGKRSRRLAGAAAIVGGATMASRLLGFVRDVVLAQFFGASATADAFFVAFRLPNLLRRVFAEGAFSQAFVPVLGGVRAQAGEADERAAVRDLLAHVSGVLATALIVVTLIGMLTAPWLVAVIAPGFADEPGQSALAADLLRITFPYIAFISLTACAAGVLNSYGRFAVPALTPVLLNICLIVAALVFAPRLDVPVMALAWGVFVAGALQLLALAPSLARLGLLVRPRLARGHAGVRKVWRLVLPGIFGASVAQLNLLINTFLASLLVTGSISWLYYSDRLAELPLGVIGVAIGTVILPTLSRAAAGDAGDDYSATLDWALRTSAWLIAPAALALAWLAAPILATLFQHGAFTAHDVLMSRQSLVVYAFALPAWVATKVLAPGFFSRQDVRTPVRFAVISVAVNVVMAIALFRPFGHVGLALAVTSSAWVNAGLLLHGLLRDRHWQPSPRWLTFGARVTVASLAMVAVLAWLAPLGDAWWLSADPPARIARLATCIAAGAATLAIAALLLGARTDVLRRR